MCSGVHDVGGEEVDSELLYWERDVWDGVTLTISESPIQAAVGTWRCVLLLPVNATELERD